MFKSKRERADTKNHDKVERVVRAVLQLFDESDFPKGICVGIAQSIFFSTLLSLHFPQDDLDKIEAVIMPILAKKGYTLNKKEYKEA